MSAVKPKGIQPVGCKTLSAGTVDYTGGEEVRANLSRSRSSAKPEAHESLAHGQFTPYNDLSDMWYRFKHFNKKIKTKLLHITKKYIIFAAQFIDIMIKAGRLGFKSRHLHFVNTNGGTNSVNYRKQALLINLLNGGGLVLMLVGGIIENYKVITDKTAKIATMSIRCAAQHVGRERNPYPSRYNSVTEYLFCKQGVVGSSPTIGSSFSWVK